MGSGLPSSLMATPEVVNNTITKSSTVSIGLMIAIIGGLTWVSWTTATMRTKLDALPLMQQDIREIRGILSRHDGVDIRQDAEIRSLRDRVEKLEDK